MDLKPLSKCSIRQIVADWDLAPAEMSIKIAMWQDWALNKSADATIEMSLSSV